MDMRKYFDITHSEHVVLNPTSEKKLAQLVELLRLPKGAQVLDIACGKGDLLIRLAETYGVVGIGIDTSATYLDEGRKWLSKRAPEADITFNLMNGADYKPDKPNQFDVASCIGASWVFGGHEKTLEVLIKMAKPGGFVLVGEPYWAKEPPSEFLEAAEFPKEAFSSHFANADAGEKLGLNLVHTIASSKDEWDTYESLQWYAADLYARNNPDDPDLPALIERVKKSKQNHLRWGRDTLGWAIYAFRVNG